jgi:hypothetical protein
MDAATAHARYMDLQEVERDFRRPVFQGLPSARRVPALTPAAPAIQYHDIQCRYKESVSFQQRLS